MGCAKTLLIESDIVPNNLDHFARLAESVGWKLVLIEEEYSTVFYCSEECLKEKVCELF
jgi:hypothetical protein